MPPPVFFYAVRGRAAVLLLSSGACFSVLLVPPNGGPVSFSAVSLGGVVARFPSVSLVSVGSLFHISVFSRVFLFLVGAFRVLGLSRSVLFLSRSLFISLSLRCSVGALLCVGYFSLVRSVSVLVHLCSATWLL